MSRSPLEPWPRGARTLTWGGRTHVMGILNVTPDSFSEGGRLRDVATAVAEGLAMVEAGAGILDIGGESTRPGATPVSEAEERARVVPVIQELAARTDAWLSVDTMKPAVADAALRAGAHWINDITGLTQGAMLEVAARHRAGVIAMHMQGTPPTMQQAPHYQDVVTEVRDFLAGAIARAHAAGLRQVMVDPGIGFGKSLEHNLTLLRRLDALHALRAPVLLGTSRKGLIGQLTGEPVERRVEGTIATVVLGAAAGVDVVRVHDVAAVVRALKVADALVREGEHG